MRHTKGINAVAKRLADPFNHWQLHRAGPRSSQLFKRQLDLGWYLQPSSHWRLQLSSLVKVPEKAEEIEAMKSGEIKGHASACFSVFLSLSGVVVRIIRSRTIW